jgi:hypothetical protein
MTRYTYHETRGAPRRRGLDLPLSAQQRAAAQLLRDHLRGGRINKSELLEALWGDQPVHACGNDCDCEDCQAGRCPHTQGKTMHTHGRKSLGVALTPDRRQLMADLISAPESPFTPDDQAALQSMTSNTLLEMHLRYIPDSEANSHLLRANEVEVDEDDDEVAAMTYGHNLRDNARAGSRHRNRVDAVMVRHHAATVERLRRDQRAAEYREQLAAEREALGDGDPDDPEVAAMTAHEHVREELHLAGEERVRKARAASPYTPDDEEAARGGEDEELHDASDIHAELARKGKEKLLATLARNGKSSARYR